MLNEDLPEAPKASTKKAAERAASPVESIPEAVKLTPDEWAAKLGHAFGARPNIPQSTARVSPQHAAADQLYGWGEHAYHYQAEPFQLTQADYEAALATAVEYPAVMPHAAALPPSLKDRFKDFQPRASRKGRN